MAPSRPRPCTCRASGSSRRTSTESPWVRDVLSPGWSSYEWRLRYRTYDVTALLSDTFVIGLSLGNGWYRGRLGWTGGRDFYGDRLGAIAQLEITFADGHRQLVVTDETWSAGPSETLADDLYDGQTIDARLRDDAWLRPGPAPEGWVGVEAVDFDMQRAGAVRRATRRAAGVVAARSRSGPRRPGGRWSTSARTSSAGCASPSAARPVTRSPCATPRCSRHGELGVRPLRTAQATDRFVLSGGDDFFEPTKTFHGFRYAEVSGWPTETAGELTAESLEAVVVHSELRRTGHFECSDDLLNQLHSNAVWGLRGNFLDVPTDCPQRDERLGWTGDIAVFAPSAAFLYDVRDFLARLAGRPRPRAAGRRTAWSPSSCPTSSSTWSTRRSSRPRRRRRSGATRPCGSPGRSGRRTATCRCWRTSTTPWPPTCAGSSRCCRRPACGTTGSSSVTGSTRRRIRTGRSRRRPTTAWWPRPACTGRRAWSPTRRP